MNKCEKLYLAVIPGFGMGESNKYKLIQKSEIENIPYYGEYVNLYELASDKPLSKDETKKLGLKFQKTL